MSPLDLEKRKLNRTLGELLAAQLEAKRLKAWLAKIEGGDNPSKDESELREWAYEALVLGHEVPE